jgi:hypothetical protein
MKRYAPAPDLLRVRVYKDDQDRWWYQPERVTNGGTGTHSDFGTRYPTPRGAVAYLDTFRGIPAVSPLRAE